MIYTPAEVCKMLSISRQTFYKLVKGDNPRLASFRVERQYRVTAEALREYLELGDDVEIVIPPETRE